MNSKIKTIKNKICRMCNNDKFFQIINLGNHPLVNSLIEKNKIKFKDPVFPIELMQCKKCKLVQLTKIIDAEEIYKNVDYLYFSSDMPSLKRYFQDYSSELEKRFLKKKDLVVEIGCNDGIMLENFKKKYKVLGVDPATNVVLRTLKRNIPAIPEFFTNNISKKISKEWGRAKLIYANNCIAHLNDLRDFMNGITNLLEQKGVFVFECNYWGGMVKNVNYSLIYHDHFSYFSLKAWVLFAKKYKLNIFDAVVTPAQGGSLRVFLSKSKFKQTKRFKNLIDEERKDNLNSIKTSMQYKKDVLNTANKLKNIILSLKKKGKKIAGYGAAAKGMTILKCSKIGDKLDYFVDDSPAKQGYYSPVDHVPIISRNKAQSRLPDYFIILAPNYSNEIIKKEKEFLKNGGKIIIPDKNITIV